MKKTNGMAFSCDVDRNCKNITTPETIAPLSTIQKMFKRVRKYSISPVGIYLDGEKIAETNPCTMNIENENVIIMRFYMRRKNKFYFRGIGGTLMVESDDTVLAKLKKGDRVKIKYSYV